MNAEAQEVNPSINKPFVDYELCTANIERCMAARLVPFVKGKPGIGKSALHRAIAEANNLYFIDLRLGNYEPPDLGGFPVPDHSVERIKYYNTSLIPIEGDVIPEGYKGFYVHFDEFNHVDLSMAKASYQIVLDRLVGFRKVHPEAFICCSGNNEEDNAGVNDLPTPLRSRLIHLNLRESLEGWTDWANTNGIDSRIIACLNWKSSLFNTFNVESPDDTYACPRTWDFLSALIKDYPELDRKRDHALIAGTVSVGVAHEFMGYVKVYKNLITLEDIIADPEGVDIPRGRTDIISALSGTIADGAKMDNLDKLFKFIQRMPADYSVITTKAIVKRQPELVKHPILIAWVQDQAAKYFDN